MSYRDLGGPQLRRDAGRALERLDLSAQMVGAGVEGLPAHDVGGLNLLFQLGAPLRRVHLKRGGRHAVVEGGDDLVVDEAGLFEGALSKITNRVPRERDKEGLADT
jgi:hypothetical protein